MRFPGIKYLRKYTEPRTHRGSFFLGSPAARNRPRAQKMTGRRQLGRLRPKSGTFVPGGRPRKSLPLCVYAARAEASLEEAIRSARAMEQWYLHRRFID